MFPATSTTDLNSAYFSQRMRQILVTYPLSHKVLIFNNVKD